MIRSPIKQSGVVALGIVGAWSVAPALADSDAALTNDADIVRALIAEMIADAESRSSLLQSGATAGHDGKSFYLGSADGDFLMRINGLLQYRWIGNFRGNESRRPSSSPDDNSEAGFEFRRVELGFGGHIHDVGYQLVLATEDGAAGVEQIIAQDVKIDYAISNNLTIAGGRYFAPFLREELIGGGGSLPVALSFMNNTLSIGRGEDVEVIYETDSFRGRVFFSDGAGSGGGGGVNNPTADSADWALTFRSDVKLAGDWGQWGDFTAARDAEHAAFIGGAIHVQGGETGDTVASNDTDLFNWTVDGSYEKDGLNLFASAAGNHIETTGSADIDNFGFVLQAGYMMDSNKLEPFLTV